MKPQIFLFSLLLLSFSCSEKTEKDEFEADEPTYIAPEEQTVQEFVVGDLNGNGTADVGTLYPPTFTEDGLSCTDDSCIVRIEFADESIPDLRHALSIGGFIEDLGDLNGDGRAELLYVPDWFQSCWGSMHVYQLGESGWEESASVSLYWCEEEFFAERVKYLGDDQIVILAEIPNDGAVEERVDTFTLRRFSAY